MAPVRVKVYGLLSRTRRQYVSQQVVAVVLMIPLLAIWVYWQTQIVPELAGRNLPRYLALLMGLFDAIPWLVAPLLLAIALETFLVMRIFARKEAEQRASEAKENVSRTREAKEKVETAFETKETFTAEPPSNLPQNPPM